MVKLILETDNLVLEQDYFSVTIDKLSFFILEIIGLGVDHLVEVIDPGELLGDVVLQLSSLGSEICRFLALHIVLVIELVDFLSILSISLPEVL